RPTVGASLKTGMQMYSKAEPLREPELDRPRKLCGVTNRSHGHIHFTGVRVTGFGLLVAAAVGCVSGAPTRNPQPATRNPTAGTIDAAELVRDLTAFAHDSMRGRETGTPDAMRAAQFIADRLAALGLEPVGDSLYFQRVPMVRQVITPATKIFV